MQQENWKMSGGNFVPIIDVGLLTLHLIIHHFQVIFLINFHLNDEWDEEVAYISQNSINYFPSFFDKIYIQLREVADWISDGLKFEKTLILL